MNVNLSPQGNYLLANRCGDFIYTAGITPRKKGVLIKTGKVLHNDDLESYKEVVRQATENALNAAKSCLQKNEQIAHVVSLSVFINSAPDFILHSKIGDFASQYLYEQLGETGIGSRVAIGVASLPDNAPVEIQLVAFIKMK